MGVDSRESAVHSAESPVGSPARLVYRVVIERIRPEIDGGRFAIKRSVGEEVDVIADIFADGYDVIAAVLRDRHGLTAESAKTTEKNIKENIFSAGSASSA